MNRFVYLPVLLVLISACASNMNTPALSSLSTPELKVFTSDEIENLNMN